MTHIVRRGDVVVERYFGIVSYEDLKELRPKRDNKGKSLLETPSDFVVVDIETTGLDSLIDEIIEIGALKVVNNEIVDSFTSLVKPEERIDDFIVELTGITNDMVKGAPKINEVLPEFIDFLGNSIILGHNIHFDVNFLYDAANWLIKMPISNDIVDTLRLSRKLVKNIENHKLKTLTEYFNISVEPNHRAVNDCYATLEVYRNICELIKTTGIVLKDLAYQGLNAKDIKAQSEMFDGDHILFSKGVVFTGTMEHLTRREAMQLAANIGAIPQNNVVRQTNFLVLGNLEYPNHSFKDGKSGKQKKAEKLILEGQDLQIISENTFLDMLSG